VVDQINPNEENPFSLPSKPDGFFPQVLLHISTIFVAYYSSQTVNIFQWLLTVI